MKNTGCSYEKARRVVSAVKRAALCFFLVILLFGASEAFAKTLIFSWNPSTESDVVGYHIAYGYSHSRYTTAQYIGAHTSFTLPGVSQGQTVYFVVQSQNSNGLRSAPSEELAVLVGSAGSPLPPGIPRTPGAPPSPFTRGNCSDWNTTISDGFVRSSVSNVLRIQNLSRVRQQALIGLYDAGGNLFRTSAVTLRPLGRHDFGLGGKVPVGQYGSVCLEQNAPLSAAMIYSFSNGSRTARRRFSFALPVYSGVAGYQAVDFNTYQPSRFAGELGLPVANAMTIRNASSQPGNGAVVMYDLSGNYLWSFPVTLAPGQRADFSLHQAGPNLAGSAIWIPEQFDLPFVVRNIRYYYDNAAWRASFLGAAPLEARPGSISPGQAMLSTRAGRSTVLEISNVQPIPNQISVAVFGAAGNLITVLSVPLNSLETRHILVDSFLGLNTVGRAVVQGSLEGGAIFSALQYAYGRGGKLLSVNPS